MRWVISHSSTPVVESMTRYSYDITRLSTWFSAHSLLFVLFMLRNPTAILLILSFAIQSFPDAASQLIYTINPAPFAARCDNKARPQMKCHGKCQLMKKIQEEERQRQQNPERRPDTKIEIITPPSRIELALQVVTTFHIYPATSGGRSTGPLTHRSQIFSNELISMKPVNLLPALAALSFSASKKTKTLNTTHR